MRLPHGAGVVTLTAPTAADPATVGCTLWLEAVADLQAAVQRCRRLLDLDADPVAVDAHLGADPLLAHLVAQRPGLRSPGAVDGGELLVRAIIGQQVSVAGARTVTARLVERWGEPLALPTAGGTGVDRLFPSARTVAALDASELPMPMARARSLVGACAALADGTLTIDAGVDRAELSAQLVAIPGIGPVVAMGWLASLALGAVAGGATGGIIGALVESGESKENAALYAEALRRGGAIVTAKVPDDEAAKYKAILSEKSFDVTTRESAWRESGWKGYDPAAPAYDAEQVRKERDIYRV